MNICCCSVNSLTEWCVEGEISWSTFYLHGLPLIQAWISNYIPNEILNEIAYLFQTWTVQLFTFGMDKYFQLTLPGHVITYPCWE